MTALTRPRGPLPARVYWTRRVLLLATALALVVGVGMALTRGSDGSGGDGTAVQAASDQSSGPDQKAKKNKKNKSKKSAKPSATPLAQPSGPCAASDIDVTPIVKNAVAGSDVKLKFSLVTRVSAACTWRVSADTLTLKITFGDVEIWSSRQCPAVVPTRDLVIRKAKPARFSMAWSGRRSDDECSTDTTWVLPGTYGLSVAPLAGEPEAIDFRLKRPTGDIITASPTPEKGHGPTAEPVPGKNPGKSPSKDPSKSPSGAVEPTG